MEITTKLLKQLIIEELEEAVAGKCESGYKTHPTQPTKKMYGKTYRNCIKAESIDEQELDEKKGSKRQRKKKAKKKGNKICPKGIAWAKRTFDTYPSAYANLAASKYCKDPNYAKDSKKRSKKNESLDEGELDNWLKQKWKRVTSSGKIAGDCGTSKDKKNPDRCLPLSKAKSMSKSERAATGRKKKAAQKSGKDSGKSSYVSNTKKGKVKTKESRQRFIEVRIRRSKRLNENDFKPHMMYDPKSNKKVKANKVEDHERLAKKGYTHVDPAEIRKIIGVGQGGAAGMEPFLEKFGKEMEDEIIKTLEAMPDIGKHKNGDYVMADKKEIDVVKEEKKNCGCGQDPCKTYGIQEQTISERELEEKKKKPCKKAKGKKFVKRVNGKCRSFGQAGKAKDGGARIRPGTKKGHAFCARTAKIKKCKNPPCANDLSRKKWKCQGSRSVPE